MKPMWETDPDDVRRVALRVHYAQRVVLTSSVCRNWAMPPMNFMSHPPRAALVLL